MIINIHYAFQLCDIANREHNERICGTDRTLLSKKSLKSFLVSVQNCVEKFNNTKHTIKIFNDRSTNELLNFVDKCIAEFSSEKIIIEIEHLKNSGIYNSIKQCYIWMQLNGKDFVYQIQDDYIFTESAIFEMVELQTQLKNELNEYVILSPWNDSWLWRLVYRNTSTSRVVICSNHRYWIQYYDTSCSFFLHHSEFSKHWDYYHEFFDILKKLPTSKKNDLENKSLNYMLNRRGVLGLVPINSVAFHIQSEIEEDPHIDWRELWNSIEV